MALLTFLGAIQQVTGSCYLVESRDGAKVLGPLPELVEFTAEQIIEQTASNDAVFVDTR